MIPRAILHITNGRSAVHRLQEAGVRGSFLPWDDVLHEGPVPAGLGVAALRARRAAFLASCGWGTTDGIERDLAGRDAIVESAERFEEVVLWFEHDLYDQLQLLQVMDQLPPAARDRTTAVLAGDYLSEQPLERLAAWFEARQPVTSAQWVAAADAWATFRAERPTAIREVLPRVEALPHLAPALRRHLQQFPAVGSGLSRTEAAALGAVAGGATRLADAFAATNAREDAKFMGDAAFLFHVSSLISGSHPLLRVANGLLLASDASLTAAGEDVLAGRADRVALNGLDRWLGGVRLSASDPIWRWDEAAGVMRSPVG